MNTPKYAIESTAKWISIRDHKPDNNQQVVAYGEPFRSNGPRMIVATYKDDPSNT